MLLGFCRSSGCCVAPLFLRERLRNDIRLDDDPLYPDEKPQDNLLVEEVSERNHSNAFIISRNMVVFHHFLKVCLYAANELVFV